MDTHTNILGKLASARERNDEHLNVALAEEIAANNDQSAIEILMAALTTGSTAVKSDAIKVLYEIGERNPSLIADYAEDFVHLLGSKNNRLQWGAMTALAVITPAVPDRISGFIPQILDAAERGSVITRDNAVRALIQLCATGHATNAYPLLLDQLRTAPTNQLPMYAELAMPVIDAEHQESFVQALRARLDDIPQESKRKRVEKVFRRFTR